MTDIHGRRWSFFDKPSIFDDAGRLTPDAPYPQEVAMACEVLTAGTGPGGEEIVLISTRTPWDIASVEGQTEFQVSGEQLVPAR
ncbi:hypothetical protein [Nonomuraea zeae]|uniref:Uncharacterized protein n=1 Tax=Nonomuraea zeae TaxID=1642303 RepID=A0A5S4G3J3_9ACTN|nr:hypothetical protein [Nonomuraea zeae]TMR27548.1 hypothetical protein ETD85_38765 [Nonomuraea zeae]